jgi:solute carrier family 35 protein E3
MATVTDIELNFWGVMWAIAGIISTSFYQIWVKSKQQDLGLDSYQLLFLQAPPSALLVFALSAVSEPISGPGGLLDYAYTYSSLSAILGTAVLSFCVNLSIFLVIGKTSPVAYNVLGYFKLVCILAAGFLFFHEEANTVKVAGTVITFVGVCVYTQMQQSLKSGWEGREKQAEQQNGSATSQQQKAAGATKDEATYSLLSMPSAVASAEAEAEGETGGHADTAIAVEALDHADADADTRS